MMGGLSTTFGELSISPIPAKAWMEWREKSTPVPHNVSQLDKAAASAHRKSYGYIGHIRKIEKRANASTPFLTHVVTKISFTDGRRLRRTRSIHRNFAHRIGDFELLRIESAAALAKSQLFALQLWRLFRSGRMRAGFSRLLIRQSPPLSSRLHRRMATGVSEIDAAPSRHSNRC